MTNQQLRLWDVPEETQVTIHSFGSDIQANYLTRLRDLGFFETGRVTCLKRLPFGGPMVLQVGENVFSLTQELAVNIFISNLPVKGKS